ncbi:hypothetical protein [Candidatus Poriferisodalis sp.]|uniref:hypothetical protein n=1 Tax=Candidatus Poriferisodalis sp. TaxID=3101277 RepID=UPI003B5BFC70
MHGEIENTQIDIAGNVEVAGPVRLGEKELRCNSASFGAGLTSAGEVICETLDVTGDVRISGHTLLG